MATIMQAVHETKVSNEWIKIALLMNFGLSDVQNIKKKCGDDPKKCCTEIFERWLSAGRKWENLLPILKEVLDSETFENIEGKLENIEKAHAAMVMSQSTGKSSLLQTMTPHVQLPKEKPRLKDLNRIFVEKHATKWKYIAAQLDISTEDIEIIEVYSPSAQERCRVMLLVWLQRDPKASWKKLHDVLEGYHGSVEIDLRMEYVSNESYSDLKEWKFVDTVKVNHLSSHDEKINYIKDFPVAVFTVIPDKQSHDSYFPTVPNQKIMKSCEHYAKVRMPIPSDHYISELSESDNVIKLLCIKKDGTQFEKILSEVLNLEPLEDLCSLTKLTKKYKNVFLLFIRPVPIKNEDKQKVKSKAEDITSFEEAESCSTETKTDALKKTCKIFLEKYLDKPKETSITTEFGKLLASKEHKPHDPYTKYVVEERESKAAYIQTICHVSNQLASSHPPNWNEVQVTEARYPQYHGDLLLGLPVAGFTIMPLVRSIYPFIGNSGNEYYQVSIDFDPNEYRIFTMHTQAPQNPHPAQIHLLCIRNDPNDSKSIRIDWLLGSTRLTRAEIENYFQRDANENTSRQVDGTVKIVYFIENIDIEKGNWRKIEKQNYDYGVPQDARPNMTNIQLLEDWITRQEERIIIEFIFVSILNLIIQ